MRPSNRLRRKIGFRRSGCRRSSCETCERSSCTVEVFTRYLAKELGPRGISANVVAPGPVQTDFSGGMVRDNPEVNQQVSAMTALGRPGVADDIGPMIAGVTAAYASPEVNRGFIL